VAARIRILAVDDHHIVREGLTSLICRQPDMTVVASAATGEEAVRVFRQHHPDITIMDLQLPGMSGLEAIRAIRAEDPAARVVVLTMYHGDEDIFRALEAGAVTYLLKDTVMEDLVRIVRAVHAGERPLPPNVERLLAERAGRTKLTPRELEIVQLMAEGMRNRDIADELQISPQTLKVHMKNILEKLQVGDRTAVVSVALKRGIVHLP
jgi:two-component system NarL family response regulator